MPASTDYICGIKFLLKANGSIIGGGQNATLTMNQDAVSTTSKASSNWKDSINGARDWEMSFDDIYLESSAAVAGNGVGLTIGGTSLKGITQVTIGLSSAFDEIRNTTTGLDRNVCATERTMTIDVEADYYDPLGTGADALSDLYDEIDGSTTSGLAVVVTNSNLSFTVTMRPTSFEVQAPVDGHTTVSLSLESIGEPTDGSTPDTGLDALFTAFWATDGASSITALLATATAGNSQYSGTAFPSEITITIPYTGRQEVSGTLIGSGALTKAATT